MRKLLLVPVALAAVLVWAVPGSAQDAVHIRQADTTKFPLVGVTVSTDTGVLPTTITVLENGHPVKILSRTSLTQTSGSFDVVLAIDTSNSVAGSPLQAAIAAAKGFVEKLPAGIPVGVVTVDSEPTVVQELTTDHAAALTAIQGISGTRYGTHLYDGVALASKMFSGDAQHNVVMLTDGTDVGSTTSFHDAIVAAKDVGANFVTVGLGSLSQVGVHVLKTLSKGTGGEYLPAVQTNLSTIYEGLARQLSNQYLVTYHSGAKGGAQITLTVRAAGGQDQSLLLAPKNAASVNPSAPLAVEHPFLHGAWALGLVLGLTFATAFLLLLMLLGANTRMRRQRDLTRRMVVGKGQAESGKEREASMAGWIPEQLVHAAEHMAGNRGNVLLALERKFEQAGIKLRTGEFLVLSGAAAVVGGLLGGILLSKVVFALLFAVLGAAGPTIWLTSTIQKRSKKLQTQLPDVLMMMASSLRAGHGFLQALDTVAKEVGDPTGTELARVIAEIRLGRRPDEALSAMAERVDNEDFRWTAMAVNIQREVGGNLAEILDTVAETVRGRAEMKRQIGVLSAEGRLSAGILVALPFLLALYMLKVNPDYLKLLFNTRFGLIMVAGASVLMVAGISWIRRIVKIDV